jgi:DeoR family suf operon transcriptional repressor
MALVQRTRRLILEFLKQRGRATLDELAQESGLAPMSVRGHLSVLDRDGLICYEEERGKVGRPRFVYSLTDRGHEQFPKSYHTLCNRVLDAVAASATDAAAGLARSLAEKWAADYSERLAGKGFDEMVQVLTDIRSEEGAMACCEPTEDGYLIHQHHCPASCVAARHPQIICAAEMGFIHRLIQAPVERVSWVQNGDATCSYRIRRPAPPVTALGSSTRSVSSLEISPVCQPAPAD